MGQEFRGTDIVDTLFCAMAVGSSVDLALHGGHVAWNVLGWLFALFFGYLGVVVAGAGRLVVTQTGLKIRRAFRWREIPWSSIRSVAARPILLGGPRSIPLVTLTSGRKMWLYEFSEFTLRRGPTEFVKAMVEAIATGVVDDASRGDLPRRDHT